MYWMIIDFESVCDEDPVHGKVRFEPPEIIEFPAVLINKLDLEKVAEFHTYIRPQFVTKLPEFCSTLTGITQDMVEKGCTFPVALAQFEAWCRNQGSDQDNTSLVTFGAWDLKKALPKCCQAFGLEIPPILDVGRTGEYLNFREAHRRNNGDVPSSIPEMLRNMGREFKGQEHRGKDDVTGLIQALKHASLCGWNLNHTT